MSKGVVRHIIAPDWICCTLKVLNVEEVVL